MSHVGEDAKLDTCCELVATGCCTSSQNPWSRSGDGKKEKGKKSLTGFAVTLGTRLRMLDGTSTYGLAGADWPCFA